jgi:hypothetical protein
MNNFSEFREFLEKKPLYSWQKFERPEFDTPFTDLSQIEFERRFTNLSQIEFERLFTDLAQIEMECPTCKRSRPFGCQRIRLRDDYSDDDYPGDDYRVEKLASRIYPFWFKCYTCSSSEYTFFIEVDIENSRIRKVGQSPPWPTNLDKNIARFLGDDDAEFFNKALKCESQGYGIAAYSYYRRVLENSIVKILETLRSILEMQGSSSEKIKQIDRALKETLMDKKIDIAKKAIPKSLTPNGMNPLATIYDTLSAGIHRLSEDECRKKSKEIRVALSYLIKILTLENEEQRAYIEATKSLNDFNSKSS